MSTDKYTCEVCKTDTEVSLVSPMFRHEHLCKACIERLWSEMQTNRPFLGED